jgi:thiol-disulfide isomerase/thioredoxin
MYKHIFWLIILLTSCLILLLTTQSTLAEKRIYLEYFYSETCSLCSIKTPVIDYIEQQYKGVVIIERYNINNEENFKKWYAYGFSEVPSVVINNEMKITHEDITKDYLENIIILYLSGEKPNITNNETVLNIPFIGKINTTEVSLPLLAVLLGGLDSFNPCSFFVLLFLLSLLLYVKSRRRMFIVGCIFIFFSGFIYFIFMSALLNIFLLTSQLTIITILAGTIAIILATLNIKDFFFFKKGISASIPESKKHKLFERMRNVVKTFNISTMIFGTIVLAIFANTYELFCTMGFPMIFTRILTLHNLHFFQYYFYIFLYNLVYVLPLIVIVLIFTITLGRKKLTEWQGRILKLVSGNMMLLLGFVLILKPDLLNNVITAVGVIAFALVIAAIIVAIWKKLGYKDKKNKKCIKKRNRF